MHFDDDLLFKADMNGQPTGEGRITPEAVEGRRLELDLEPEKLTWRRIQRAIAATDGSAPDRAAVTADIRSALRHVGERDVRGTLAREAEKLAREAGIEVRAHEILRELEDEDKAGSSGRDKFRPRERTYGDGIIDIVRAYDGSLKWLAVIGNTPRIVTEFEGRVPWRRSALPWPLVPDAGSVEAALRTGAGPPFAELTEFVARRVLLPEPRERWAQVLAGWVLGSYFLSEFNYFPLLLLEGPPERGKTRLGKAVLWPAFRGYYTPSPTEAAIFRDRAYHGVTLMLDVEDLPRTLDRSAIGDLVLASFERDCVVRRCTRSDAPPPDQMQSFAAYGPTILVTNRPIRDESPLASRCIRMVLPEAGQARVPNAAKPEDAASLRTSALAWAARLQAGGSQLPHPEIPLAGRARDLATPVVRVLAAVAPEVVEEVVRLFEDLEADRRGEAADHSWEARVALGLSEAKDLVDSGRLYVEDLARVVNEGVEESEQLTAQQVGVARKALGLRGGRGGKRGKAYVVWPGDDQVEALRERYTPPHKSSGSSGSTAARTDTQRPGLRIPGEDRQNVQQIPSLEGPHESWMAEDAEDAEGYSGGSEGRRPRLAGRTVRSGIGRPTTLCPSCGGGMPVGSQVCNTCAFLRCQARTGGGKGS